MPQFEIKAQLFTAFEVTYIQNAVHLFIGTNNLELLHFTDNGWESFTTENKLLSNRINGLVADEKVIYVVNNNGLSIIENNNFNNIRDHSKSS